MSKSPPRARRLPPEARRRAILDAAIRLFGRSGYSNISAAEIAHKAGVTPALVHHYFGPKRQIFLAIMAEWQQLAVQIARYPALWMATDSEGGASGDQDVAATRGAVRLGAVELILKKFDDVVDDTPAARWALLGFTGYHDIAMRAYMRGEIDAATTISLLAEGLSATLTTTIPALNRSRLRPGVKRKKSPGKR